MLGKTIRTSLWAWMAGVLLVACGGTHLEADSALAEESLGTQESSLCAGLSVSSLTLSDATMYLNEVSGVGYWAVSQFSNAVRLDYYIDGVRYAFDERPGNAGAWYFSTVGIPCGTHYFQVNAWPMVIDSNGNRTTCGSTPSRTVGKYVSWACPPPDPDPYDPCNNCPGGRSCRCGDGVCRSNMEYCP
ncbi:hypothetical protein [Stigmatella erecta]|uniref:Uncharacterized protein n=1 Tax=Stigmatella erecta TaxID=83460 RepID=A0A1I0L6I3_9BACT|nr:hypothetical protein [Stigmatella erecta]SEU35215.1 hypothetical protein SAMN05443639_12021 [Stigmatella erecta]